MIKSVIIPEVALIFLALFNVPATAADVNGAWYMGGPMNAAHFLVDSKKSP